MRTANRTGLLLVARLAAVAAVLGGCSGGTSGAHTASGSTAGQAVAAGAAASPGATATGVDPCSLLTDAEVATFDPGLKPHTLENPVPQITICAWPDAKGIPNVQLQVFPATGSLKDQLTSGLGAGGGYSVESVGGLGDEAVAAYTTANASLNIKAGDLAALEARSGARVVMISVTYESIRKGSPSYRALTAAMATALSRLP